MDKQGKRINYDIGNKMLGGSKNLELYYAFKVKFFNSIKLAAIVLRCFM